MATVADKRRQKKGIGAQNRAGVVSAPNGDRWKGQTIRRNARRDASGSNMTPRLQTIVEKFPDVQRPEQIHALVDTLRATYDLDHAIYYALSLGGDRAGEEYGAMTYSPDWHTHYEDAGYRFSDPAVKSMLGGSLPVDWSGLDWTDRAARRLKDESIDTGVGNLRRNANQAVRDVLDHQAMPGRDVGQADLRNLARHAVGGAPHPPARPGHLRGAYGLLRPVPFAEGKGRDFNDLRRTSPGPDRP